MIVRSRRPPPPINLPLMGCVVMAFAAAACGAVLVIARQYGLA